MIFKSRSIEKLVKNSKSIINIKKYFKEFQNKKGLKLTLKSGKISITTLGQGRNG